MQRSKWIGIHNGQKIGKKFQAPATKRTKAHVRFDANLANHEAAMARVEKQSDKKAGSLRNNAPGSMKWPAGGRR